MRKITVAAVALACVWSGHASAESMQPINARNDALSAAIDACGQPGLDYDTAHPGAPEPPNLISAYNACMDKALKAAEPKCGGAVCAYLSNTERTAVVGVDGGVGSAACGEAYSKHYYPAVARKCVDHIVKAATENGGTTDCSELVHREDLQACEANLLGACSYCASYIQNHHRLPTTLAELKRAFSGSKPGQTSTSQWSENDLPTTNRQIHSEISIGALRRAAATVKKYKPRDQFDTGPQTAELVGKRFEFEIAPRAFSVRIRSKLCTATPQYDYFEGKLDVSWGGSLSLDDLTYFGSNNKPLPSIPDGSISSPEAEGYAVGCTVTSGGKYLGGNAFGAMALVRRRNETAITLISLQFENGLSFSHSWSRAISSEAARALAKEIRIRVSGAITEWTPGHAIECGVAYDTPTISSPVETKRSTCFVKVVFEREDLVDAATGKILKTVSP